MSKLARIKNILLKEHKKISEDDGAVYTVCSNPYYELEGVLQDVENRTIDTDIKMGITKLEDTYKIDKICINTIKRVQKQLAEVLKVIEEPEDNKGHDIDPHEHDWRHPKVEDKEH